MVDDVLRADPVEAPPGNESFRVELESKMYQLEVSLLEDTGEYLQVVISVDDGTLPASFRPVSSQHHL